MTEDRANNSNMTARIQGAFDAFVGFVYATTISLVIKTAYCESKFSTVWSVVLTLALLGFFSQDWMVRVVGRLRISQTMTKSTALFAVVAKALIEITIVYFLLLASLQFVEIYTPKMEWSWTARQRLSYATAAFAIFCGVWNIVMINLSPDVKWEQIRSLFKGHLDKKIKGQFPEIQAKYNKLLTDLKKKEETFAGIAKNVRLQAQISESTDSKHAKFMQSLSNIIQWISRAFSLWSHLKSLAKTPLKIVLPYLLVFHVVTLNWVLGVFIGFSAWIFEGKSLLEWLQLRHLPLLGFAGTVSFVCAWLFLGIHFRNPKKPRFERLGCASLAILILLIYSATPVTWLVALVASQQIAANTFMTKFFNPSSTSPSTTVNERDGQS